MTRIELLLARLYAPPAAQSACAQIQALMERYRPVLAAARPPAPRAIDQRTALLITYGDQVRPDPGAAATALATLGGFLDAHVSEAVTGVHILPFYPSSSDDGFSVIDYYAVDPALGTWDDIARIGAHFDLMFDAVINHASAQSEWFQQFLRGEAPGRDYFLVAAPDLDARQVIRPRVHPLLTELETADGIKRVWTTFSADQIDLDYRSPALLLQILDVLLFYVARGARLLRLDAIAFLWKQSGTTSLHLPQTHAVIQLIRAMLDMVAPDVLVVTETNVPHTENISYFGDGANEAQWVYNFALPPLTLHTLQTGDATRLSGWAQTLATPSDTTAFFNFLASHDGIGLNPARGILSDAEITALTARTLERGGFLSYKHDSNGAVAPYEMNINYLDALTIPGEPESLSLARLLCAHAIQFALAGVPGIYFHSLFGSRGDRAAAQASGIPRRINRQKLARADLERELADPASRRAQVFQGLVSLLRARGAHRAFHPQSPQMILPNDPCIFAVLRGSGYEWALCLQNVTALPVRFDGGASPDLPGWCAAWRDLLTGERFDATPYLAVPILPYGIRWLESIP